MENWLMKQLPDLKNAFASSTTIDNISEPMTSPVANVEGIFGPKVFYEVNNKRIVGMRQNA
jgi:hypothetical protein